jgi:hypothetical protein
MRRIQDFIIYKIMHSSIIRVQLKSDETRVTEDVSGVISIIFLFIEKRIGIDDERYSGKGDGYGHSVLVECCVRERRENLEVKRTLRRRSVLLPVNLMRKQSSTFAHHQR